MSKKIWYISKYAVTPRYGNPFRQYFISKYLSRMDYDVSLIFSRSSIINSPPKRNYRKFESFDEGFLQVMLDGPKINLGFNLKRIWSWVEFEIRLYYWIKNQYQKPDVIIVSSLSILTFLTGVWAKKRFSCKLLVEVRDIYPYTLISTGKFSKNNYFIKFLSRIEKLGYDNADYILSTLYNFDKYLNEFSIRNVDKFKFIPMGIDPEFYLNSTDIENEDYLIPKDKFVVAYIGSFSRTQATKIVFDVIKLLKKDDSIFFILAGSGEEKELGLEKINGQNNYLDLGQIDKESIQYYLSKADVALNPWLDLDIYKYGISPNKWMDYMYSGTPFIVCFNDEIEMLKKAGCASVIPPEDAERLKNEIYRFKNMSSIQRKQMGMAGKKYLLDNLTYEKHAKTISELI